MKKLLKLLGFYREPKREPLKIPSSEELKVIIAKNKESREQKENERLEELKSAARDKIATHFLNGNHPFSNLEDWYEGTTFPIKSYIEYPKSFVLDAMKQELEDLGYELVDQVKETRGYGISLNIYRGRQIRIKE